MDLKKLFTKIERKIGLGDEWEPLWIRYRDIYRFDGAPLNERAVRPLPPCTIQDHLYEIRDWILDIQGGGKEIQLVKKRLSHPEGFENKFDGITLDRANSERKFGEKLNCYYACALQKLSEASHHGYHSQEIDPVNQVNFRKFIGPVSYQKLERVIARCERNKQSLLENHGYGPTGFRIFREAGRLGDRQFEVKAKEFVNSVQELIDRKK